MLDFAVDLYNEHIATEVAKLDDANGQRWRVLDVAGMLDWLAFRCYLIDDDARPDSWMPYDLPPNGEGSIFAYRAGYAAYAWITTPRAGGSASTSTARTGRRCMRSGSR